jgi:hypothetical protein
LVALDHELGVMINFRFHVVSIVAVFLAIAVGVVFGSTIVDSAIVNGLRSEIKSSERDAARTRDENERLKSDRERYERYFESTSSFAVENRLVDDAIVIIAERGTETDVVAHERELLDAAGAETVLLLWLEPEIDVVGDAVTELAAIADTVSDDPVAVRAAAFAALAARLAETSPRVSTTTSATSSDADARDVLAEMIDAGFVATDDDPGEFLATSIARRRAIVLGATDSDLAGLDALGDVAAAFDATGFETVTGEVWVDVESGDATATDRGARLHALTNGDRAERIATVDNVDEIQGRVSLVIALAEVARGTVGHYGFGSGATRSTPEWIQA